MEKEQINSIQAKKLISNLLDLF